MRRLTISLLLTLTLGANASEVVRVAPWELHNSFWMSLHQTLMSEVRKTRDLGALTMEEQAAWNEAVAAYRTAAGNAGNVTFTRPMVITVDGTTQVADDALEPAIDAPMADALRRAAPVYRKHWWPADEKANQFFLTYAAALLRDAGEELISAHEKVYRTPWPKRIRTFVSPEGGPFGAYTLTTLQLGGITTVMSSRDPGYQGLRALEMMLHESSHAVVDPNRGTVAAAISAAATKQGVPVPPDLWHAILFATSSELTRRALIERGVTDFVPSSRDMLTRVWPKYREPIEKHWLPYLSGTGTLEEAIEKVVAAAQ